MPRRTLLKVPALLTVVTLALALSACSGTPETDTADTVSASAECTPAGPLSDAITVGGDFGAAPEVVIDAPVTATATERTVAIAGTGTETAATGSLVQVTFSAYNATTGEQVDTTGYGADAAPAILAVDDTQYINGLVRAINCAVDGDRIVTVIPPTDAFGDAGSSDFNVGADDTMVFVIDVNAVVPTRATGADQPTPDGLPAVALAEDGLPTITIPDTEAPAGLQITALKKGDGAPVAEGDTVALEYTGVIWATGEEFDSSWATPGPATFATTSVVPGFGAALVGQTAGSQVLAIIPPAEGYGTAGNDQAGISGTDTLVFVVDILASTPAATQ